LLSRPDHPNGCSHILWDRDATALVLSIQQTAIWQCCSNRLYSLWSWLLTSWVTSMSKGGWCTNRERYIWCLLHTWSNNVLHSNSVVCNILLPCFNNQLYS
jgi:hypothetical protein